MEKSGITYLTSSFVLMKLFELIFENVMKNNTHLASTDAYIAYTFLHFIWNLHFSIGLSTAV